MGILTEDSKGVFFHVKIYKASRVFGEVKFRSGSMEIACRECMRWHRLFLDKGLKVEPEENRSAGVA